MLGHWPRIFRTLGRHAHITCLNPELRGYVEAGGVDLINSAKTIHLYQQRDHYAVLAARTTDPDWERLFRCYVYFYDDLISTLLTHKLNSAVASARFSNDNIRL